MEENTKALEEKPKNDSVVASPSPAENKPKKSRKPYEWTEKRKEAFDKMRKGLEEKVELTKRLKEEKRKSEKEAIKAQVREIMASKKKSINPKGEESETSSFSSESESSEEEMPKPKKKVVKEKSNKKKPKRKQMEVEDNTTSEVSDSESESEEEAYVERRVSSQHQRQQVRRDKEVRGKAVRRAQFLNPLDQFILL